MLDHRSLRYFVAAAQALHVGRAAARLGIAQPALSQQIRILESRLGVELFHRAHRRISLTAAGEVFLAEAHMVLAASERAVRRARGAAQGHVGELHVGYSGSVIYEPMLHKAIRRFRRDYPGVRLIMHESTLSGQITALGDGTLDIALLRGPLPELPVQLEQEVFLRSRLVLALPQDHPLGVREVIDPRDLAGEPFIDYLDADGTGLGECLRALTRRASITPDVVLRAGGVMSVLGLVGAGFGLTVIPEMPAEAIVPNVCIRPVLDDKAQTEILLLRSETSPSMASGTFVDMLRRSRNEEAADQSAGND